MPPLGTTLGTGCLLEVFHHGIWTGEEETLAATVLPPNNERPFGTAHFEHFAISVRLTHVMAPNDDSITDACAHDLRPSVMFIVDRGADCD